MDQTFLRRVGEALSRLKENFWTPRRPTEPGGDAAAVNICSNEDVVQSSMYPNEPLHDSQRDMLHESVPAYSPVVQPAGSTTESIDLEQAFTPQLLPNEQLSLAQRSLSAVGTPSVPDSPWSIPYYSFSNSTFDDRELISHGDMASEATDSVTATTQIVGRARTRSRPQRNEYLRSLSIDTVSTDDTAEYLYETAASVDGIYRSTIDETGADIRTRFYARSGDLGNLSLQIRNLEVDHSDLSSRREQLQDQEKELVISDREFELEFQTRHQRLLRHYTELKQEVEDLEAQCIAQGYHIERYRSASAEPTLHLLPQATVVEAVLQRLDMSITNSLLPATDDSVLPEGLKVETISYDEWTNDSPPPAQMSYDEAFLDDWMANEEADNAGLWLTEPFYHTPEAWPIDDGT